MNDNCITKVVGFRRIAMGSLVRRYIVTKGQVKPLLDACIIFPTQCMGVSRVGVGRVLEGYWKWFATYMKL